MNSAHIVLTLLAILSIVTEATIAFVGLVEVRAGTSVSTRGEKFALLQHLLAVSARVSVFACARIIIV